jgi:hypothetical protein
LAEIGKWLARSVAEQTRYYRGGFSRYQQGKLMRRSFVSNQSDSGPDDGAQYPASPFKTKPMLTRFVFHFTQTP